jgi:hypothetical protein
MTTIFIFFRKLFSLFGFVGPRYKCKPKADRLPFTSIRVKSLFYWLLTNSRSTFLPLGMLTRKKFTRVPFAPGRVAG